MVESVKRWLLSLSLYWCYVGLVSWTSQSLRSPYIWPFFEELGWTNRERNMNALQYFLWWESPPPPPWLSDYPHKRPVKRKAFPCHGRYSCQPSHLCGDPVSTFMDVILLTHSFMNFQYDHRTHDLIIICMPATLHHPWHMNMAHPINHESPINIRNVSLFTARVFCNTSC